TGCGRSPGPGWPMPSTPAEPETATNSGKSWRTPSPDGALEVGPRRPHMNDAEERLMTVFSAALERGQDGERQAYLDQACADDPALRHRVEALLRAHDRAGGFLGRVPDPAETAGAEPSTGTGPTADFAARAVIAGRYKLLERIGEGGMGEVYLAQQTEPIRRLVAGKLGKPGVDSRP